MSFVTKKVLTHLCYPLPLCLEIMALGLFLCNLVEMERLGRAMLILGFFLLVAFSYKRLAGGLLRVLERRYSPLNDVTGISDVKWVLVLGEGEHESNPTVPVTMQLTHSSLVRLVEGIRLHNMLPGSKLVLSGGSVFDPMPTAILMREVALILGIRNEEIIVEESSKDTEDEARLTKEIIGTARFILVTSAYHMRRSLEVFRNAGMNPVPAPTEYLTKAKPNGNSQNLRRYFPNAESLLESEKAFHEYFGLMWGNVKKFNRKWHTRRGFFSL